MTDQPSDADLIVEYIARHGVTVCPPATYSPGHWEPVQWRDQVARGVMASVSKRSIEAARDDDRIAAMRAQGMSLRQIASVLGRSNPAILARVKAIAAKGDAA